MEIFSRMLDLNLIIEEKRGSMAVKEQKLRVRKEITRVLKALLSDPPILGLLICFKNSL